jgi:hypothetical protein
VAHARIGVFAMGAGMDQDLEMVACAGWISPADIGRE